jgi:hypothetical protein
MIRPHLWFCRVLPFMHADRGCELAPGLPCALCILRDNFWQSSGGLRREGAEVCLAQARHPPAVIAREGGRSSILEKAKWNREASAYWIARSSRATTTEQLFENLVGKDHASLRGAQATKQSMLSCRGGMNCFASLAMTVERCTPTTAAYPAAAAPRSSTASSPRSTPPHRRRWHRPRGSSRYRRGDRDS